MYLRGSLIGTDIGTDERRRTTDDGRRTTDDSNDGRHTLNLYYDMILLNPSTTASSNPLRRGSWGCGMFVHQNHAAVLVFS